MPFEVMKAPGAIATLEDLDPHLPLMISPKLDGIRCVIRGGRALTRSMKPVPNRYVRTWLESRAAEMEGFDGELVMLDFPGGKPRPFREVTSAIMSQDGVPNFTFAVFDDFSIWSEPFYKRIEAVEAVVDMYGLEQHVKTVPHDVVTSVELLIETHTFHLERGFEGSMVRDPNGRYRHGRCRASENLIWKVKPRERTEAVVIGVERRKTPVHQRDDDGKMIGERDHVYHDEVGALRCVFDDDAKFKVGSGFSAAERVELYKQDLIGRRCLVEHMSPRETGERPRFPTFQGWVK